MKKIKGIYLSDENRLVLVTDKNEQYRIDWDDFIDPRWEKVSPDNIHYDNEIDSTSESHNTSSSAT